MPIWHGDFDLLPFGAGHHMKIVLAEHMGVDTHAAEKLGIQIGVVGDIPNVKDSQGPSMPRFKIRQPTNAFGWNAGLRTHLIMPYCALTLVNPSTRRILRWQSSDCACCEYAAISRLAPCSF